MADGGLLGYFTSGLSPETLTALYLIGLALGLILTFGGKLLWRPLMSIVGAFIGGIVGFIIGFLLGSTIGGLIGGPIGAIIGGIIFVGIAEFSIAVLAGIIGIALTAILTGNTIIGIIAGILIFILTSLFIDQVIGIMMAVIGGLIAGVCINGLGIGIETAAVIALALMIAGSAIQTLFLKMKPKRKKMPQESSVCAKCGAPLVHEKYSNRWYCSNCTENVPPPPTNPQ